jgi:hypothetical protein
MLLSPSVMVSVLSSTVPIFYPFSNKSYPLPAALTCTVPLPLVSGEPVILSVIVIILSSCLYKSSAGDIQCLACVAQLSQGISIPNPWMGIIWYTFGNERKSAQRIGRLLRLNPDQKATVHLLLYQDMVDKQWVAQALDAFDPTKISYANATRYELLIAPQA